MRSFLIPYLLLTGLLTSCAYVSAIPVAGNPNVNGIRIYDVKPILIVTSDKAEVQLVPNYNRAYALRFGAFLAKNTSNFTFENGTIKQLNSTLDSTAALKLLEVLGGKLIDKLPANAFSTTRSKGIGAPQRFAVFSFDFDEEGELVRLRPLVSGDELIHVPKPPQRRVTTVANPAAKPATTPVPAGPGFPTSG